MWCSTSSHVVRTQTQSFRQYPGSVRTGCCACISPTTATGMTCEMRITTHRGCASEAIRRTRRPIAGVLRSLQERSVSLSTSQSILGWLFLRPEFCVEAVVLTVSTRELRTDRRRAVAVGGGQPPTRQRRHSLRWLARSVVSGGIGRQVADSRGRPDAPRGPSTQLVESY